MPQIMESGAHEMNEREFFDLCLERYRYEQNQADAIYQRVGLLLTSLPILGAVAYNLGRPDLIRETFARVDIFLYMVATGFAFVCLGTSMVFLIRCVYPRHYESLPPMLHWDGWRKDYRKQWKNEKPDEDVIGSQFIALMKEKVVAAEKDYSKVNEIRRKWFQRAIFWAGLGAGAIALQAFFSLILYWEGKWK